MTTETDYAALAAVKAGVALAVKHGRAS